MHTADATTEPWQDLLAAQEFAEGQIEGWMKEGRLAPRQWTVISTHYAQRREKWQAARAAGEAPPSDLGLAAARPGESAQARALRFWSFLENELHRFAKTQLLALAQSHDLQAEVHERQGALARRLSYDELPDALPAEPHGGSPPPLPPRYRRRPAEPGRPLLEILLDPRNIQWLLAFGGALMVVGIVTLLWVRDLLQPPLLAGLLGAGNAAVLLLGWYLLLGTRHQVAGRALTLLACLIMPLNLWYYHATGLVTLQGQLWLPALAVSGLYLASALVLRDELFVYVLAGGLTLTGLLFLGTESQRRLWEVAAPATLLVVLGLLGIHLERAFPPGQGAFSRGRFGLAFFWSGQALLASGLLLLLGATVAGDWLYQPIFRPLYEELAAAPSPVVGELRWLALLLVLAGGYAYVYSDVVVRRVGVYVHIAALMLLWALVLTLQLLQLELGVDALIAILAVLALGVNLSQAVGLRDRKYTRALPVLGVALPLLAVALGVASYLRHISPDLKGVWQGEAPAWSYLGAMALTAVSCRIGAYLYRTSHPELSAVYHFATGAATLTAAATLLAALGLTGWSQHAPVLMLVPLAYVLAARLYRDGPAARPLVWVGHAAAAVMLASSLVSAVEGFTAVTRGGLNLSLALFFAEAALFYALTAGLHRQPAGIPLAAGMACAAAWQVLTYFAVPGEYYTLALAAMGLGLLVAYRLAAVERVSPELAEAAFVTAHTLLILAFAASGLLGLSRLLTASAVEWSYVGLTLALTAMGLAAVALVGHAGWRRAYVVLTIGEALLAFLSLAILSALSPWQKVEVFLVAAGLVLLLAGHVGWYREQDRENDLVTVSLLFGSLLVGVPLVVAALIDRWRDQFIWPNEFGFLASGVLLLTTGFLFRLKATTVVGGLLTGLYFLTLLVFVPWGRLDAIGLAITIGGGALFTLGLVLSVFRDRLLALPERVRRREGVFRVLGWR